MINSQHTNPQTNPKKPITCNDLCPPRCIVHKTLLRAGFREGRVEWAMERHEIRYELGPSQNKYTHQVCLIYFVVSIFSNCSNLFLYFIIFFFYNKLLSWQIKYI